MAYHGCGGEADLGNLTQTAGLSPTLAAYFKKSSFSAQAAVLSISDFKKQQNQKKKMGEKLYGCQV